MNMATLLLYVTVISSITSILAIVAHKSKEESNQHSQIPCDLNSLSGWRDSQGNIWAVGSKDLWWYNENNSTWSSVSLPNSTLSSSSWKVVCVDPSHHVILTNYAEVFMLHLPQLQWQMLSKQENEPSLQNSVLWCNKGTLYAFDFVKSSTFVLNCMQLLWDLRFQNIRNFNGQDVSLKKHMQTWVGQDNNMYLLIHQISTNSCTVWCFNETGNGWKIFDQKVEGPMPDASAAAVTLPDGIKGIWTWKISEVDLWFLDLVSGTWKLFKLQQDELSRINLLTFKIVTWTSDHLICMLGRKTSCTSQFAPGFTQCINVAKNVDSSFHQSKQLYEQESKIAQIASPVITVTTRTTSSLQVVIQLTPTSVIHTTGMAWHSHLPVLDPSSSSVVISSAENIHPGIASSDSHWRQEHSTIFGSAIFFGTSLTIFGVVGMVWCIRRCVHFPKEALLLRDPPSVRYTAIPDSFA